jgi:uncharacterized protein YbgA (DUF1722 family)
MNKEQEELMKMTEKDCIVVTLDIYRNGKEPLKTGVVITESLLANVTDKDLPLEAIFQQFRRKIDNSEILK